jgi:hypothetical protein
MFLIKSESLFEFFFVKSGGKFNPHRARLSVDYLFAGKLIVFDSYPFPPTFCLVFNGYNRVEIEILRGVMFFLEDILITQVLGYFLELGHSISCEQDQSFSHKDWHICRNVERGRVPFREILDIKVLFHAYVSNEHLPSSNPFTLLRNRKVILRFRVVSAKIDMYLLSFSFLRMFLLSLTKMVNGAAFYNY